MKKTECYTFVRYSEIDNLGITYYSHYFIFFEIGRINWINTYLLPYRKIEKEYDIGLPTVETYAKFLVPSTLSDKIKIVTIVEEKPLSTICFNYRLYVENKLITIGYTKNAFVNLKTLKPCRPVSLKEYIDRIFK
jgi:acyl-CoA thioester hydrolase